MHSIKPMPCWIHWQMATIKDSPRLTRNFMGRMGGHVPHIPTFFLKSSAARFLALPGNGGKTKCQI